MMNKTPCSSDSVESNNGTTVRRRWGVLAVLCASLMLVSIDATVLHMALPALSHDLHPTATEQLWIIAIYSLVAAPMLLTFGTLGDRFGRRRMLVVGYVIFGIASLAAAGATSVPGLIAARGALGIGGAMIMPATLSILRQTFPERDERRIAIGIWSGVAGSGAVLGPLLGGFLVEAFSWHAVFLINAPVMIVAVPVTYWLIPESADPTEGRFDIVSAILVALGIIGIAIAIKQTPTGGMMYLLGPCAGALGAVLLIAFVRRQRILISPLLDVTLFRIPAFSVAVGSVLLVLMGLVGGGLLLAQYLQVVLALSPTHAAARLMFVMVAAVVGSVAAGPLLKKFGNRTMTVAGFSLGAVALGTAAVGLATHENLWMLGPALVGVGFGVSVALTAASDALMAAAPAEQSGAASAVEETAYELGAGLGVALLGSLATGIYSATFPAVSGVSEGLLTTAKTGLTEAVNVAGELPGYLGDQVLALAQHAYVDGVRVSLGTGTVCFALAAVTAAQLLPKRDNDS